MKPLSSKDIEREKIQKELENFTTQGGKIHKISRQKFYIYFLIDPRSHKVFYIGKGQKSRMYDHEELVKLGKIPNNNYDLRDTIKEILDCGQEIIYKQVWTSNDESYIYQKEKDFIKKHKEILTNIQAGGGFVYPAKKKYKKHKKVFKLKKKKNNFRNKTKKQFMKPVTPR